MMHEGAEQGRHFSNLSPPPCFDAAKYLRKCWTTRCKAPRTTWRTTANKCQEVMVAQDASQASLQATANNQQGAGLGGCAGDGADETAYVPASGELGPGGFAVLRLQT